MDKELQRAYLFIAWVFIIVIIGIIVMLYAFETLSTPLFVVAVVIIGSSLLPGALYKPNNTASEQHNLRGVE